MVARKDGCGRSSPAVAALTHEVEEERGDDDDASDRQDAESERRREFWT
jgi:hypothetical protein